MQKWKTLDDPRPEPFDMIEMEVILNGRKKSYFGWWTASTWYCIKIKQEFKPIRWKRSDTNFY